MLQICEKFDETLYGQLQAAYALLGKTQAAMDQLHMHFTSAIQNTALKVIKSFVGKSESIVATSGKQYNELCKVSIFQKKEKVMLYLILLGGLIYDL